VVVEVPVVVEVAEVVSWAGEVAGRACVPAWSRHTTAERNWARMVGGSGELLWGDGSWSAVYCWVLRLRGAALT
jgi:hypothetical protein